MAFDPSSFLFGIFENLNALQANSTLSSLFPNWSSAKTDGMFLIQSASLAGDPNQQRVVQAMRSFIKNNDIVTRTLEMGGKFFDFLPATSYAPSDAETALFLTQALDRGYDFSLTTFSDWLATGVAAVFFE